MITKTCLLALIGLLSAAAQAMDSRPCADPRVFPGAAVNAIVMPYRFDERGDGPAGNPASAGPELRLASRQIAALVHLEVLTSMLKYGAVGATDLLAEADGICDVDRVVARLSQPGAPGALRAGQALVMVWGRLFAQGEQLYVQSYIRFFRQGERGPLAEVLNVAAGEGTARLNLQANWPTQALAFAPRRISRTELARVDQEFRNAMVLRERPDAAAPGRVMAFEPGKSFPYAIKSRQGDWLQLTPMQGGTGGTGGWVKARAGGGDAEAWSLQRWLPELAFVDAVNGMMRLRVGNLSEAEAAPMRLAVEQGLAHYERAVPVDQAPTVWGLGAVMRAQIAWTAGQRSDAAFRYARASTLLPAYAGARNLAAVTALADTRLDAASAARLQRQLLAALALAPTDKLVLANLAQLYQLYEKEPSWSPLAPAELLEQAALVKAAQGR